MSNVLRQVLKQRCPDSNRDQQDLGAASQCSAEGSEARMSPLSKVGEIGLFQPQWAVGIFGALVSNDRAAVWAEGEENG